MDISIVTPSYNQLPWLRLCIASVADQSGVALEHIVQDAGSGGDLTEWPKRWPHLRVFVEPDEGMYDAVNRGLRRANGEICAYLNCDEQYLPGTLTKVVTFFRDNPQVELLFGDAILTDRNGNPLSYRRIVPPRATHLRLAHLGTLSCSMFFRRTVLGRGFLFDAKWKDIGDAVWVEQLLMAKVPIATLPEPLAVFAFTGENRSKLALAAEEGASRKGKSLAQQVRRLSAIAAHRLRKLLAGAYTRRDLEIAVFTLDSPEARQLRSARKVGFGWPK